jgi:hypothetical protein
MSSLLTNSDNQETRYIVKVNGQVRSAPLTKALAESFIQQLPLTEQSSAQIVPATGNGQEILLG